MPLNLPDVDLPDWTTTLVAGTAFLAFLLAVIVWRRRPVPPRHRYRHVALQVPLLAPARYCACGRCAQLAAGGSLLAAWHYDVPGVLSPDKAPDAVPIQGIAWTYGPNGWEPAIVYVVANLHPDAAPMIPHPSTNGQVTQNGDPPRGERRPTPRGVN